MADILIRGMEMPKSCYNCPCEQVEESYYGDIIHRECSMIYKGYTMAFNSERREDCPLIEVPEWIPVTERWPEQFKPVLVYYNRNGCSGMGVAEYYHDGDTKVWRGCGFIPTHWMPLPEPPKDGRE